MSRLTKTFYAAWLVISLNIIGYDILSWQFHLVIIPTIFIEVFFNHE